MQTYMTLPAGTRLGHYEIAGPIGAGGMGEVYGARDTRLNRIVAIKVLPPGFAHDSDRLQRFELEAQAAGSLNHPNIVAVYDLGTHQDTVYLVTELLEGETLRVRISGSRLPVRRAVEYAIQIAGGLAAAHAKGIVHRDIKPENLFLTSDGFVKILDFGLAKLTPPRPENNTSAPTAAIETDPGMVMGTAGYMSPEQVRGVPVDHRSDLFSLGTVLYEMLAGKRAFSGDSPVETMSAILKEEPPELPGTVPRPVDRILRRCLEKKPEERFESARDLAFALQALAGDATHQAAPPSVRRKVWRVPILVAAAFAAGVILALLLGLPTQGPQPILHSLTYSGHDSSPAISPDGKTIAFSSDRDGRHRIWLKQLAGRSEVVLTAGPDDSPRFAPDGSTILFCRNEGVHASLYRIASLGGEPRKLLDDVVNADYSPDGSIIAFARWNSQRQSSVVGLANSDGSDSREIAEFVLDHLDFPRWSPDGRNIVLVGSPQGGVRTRIYVISSDGKQKQLLDIPATASMSSAVWSTPDQVMCIRGDRFAGMEPTLVRYNVRSKKTQFITWSHYSSVLDYMPPGRLVFDTESNRSNLKELPLRGDSEPRWLTRGSSLDREPVYSLDDKRIVFSSNRSGNMDIWQLSRETGAVTQLTDHEGADLDPGISPDGKWLIWTSDRNGHFEIFMALADGSGARQLTQDGYDAENATMTANGQWVVYASANPAKTGIWKIHPDGSGAQPLVNGNCFNPEVSADGQYALYVTSLRSDLSAIRVVRINDGVKIPFEIQCPIRKQGLTIIGRARWFPSSRAIAYVSQDASGTIGIYAQNFAPGSDTTSTRRKLAGFDPDVVFESLGLSPDGSRITVSVWEPISSLMLADHVRVK
jgi:serine/threonine protein kinase/dipeptidyl aminopeptidase/acylaminoacyl peptidase